jgi:site-specific DNA-methyltransferase (adenine-specific)
VGEARPVALGDAIDGLWSLAAGSVGLVLSDLPSGETRADFDIAPDLQGLWPAVWHALRPDGSAIFMASSLRFAARVIASQKRFFRHDLVWHKSLATGHLNAKRAPLRAHEFILVFSRVPPAFQPQMVSGATPIHAARRAHHGENYGPQTRVTHSRAGATDRYPTSVLEFASVGTSSKKRRHPQQKPDPLLAWLIRSYSRPGDVVVDPYAGSGSTGDAAAAEGRSFIGWDSSPRFGRALPTEPGAGTTTKETR